MIAKSLGVPYNCDYIFVIGYHTGHDKEFELLSELGIFSSYDKAQRYIDVTLNKDGFYHLKPVRFKLNDVAENLNA